MTKRPSWSPGAMERLRKEGEKAFIDFLNEVPPETARALAKSLPPVKGFRKGTPQELIHQKRTLASKFMARGGVSSGDRTRSDNALYTFWRAWGKEHLGSPRELNDLLNEMELLLDQEDGAELPEVLELVDRLFLMLKEASDENRSSRENIERFFLFGPFEGSVSISAAIASSKSAKEVARDRAIHGLPERLHRDEEVLRSLDDRLNALVVEFETLSDGVDQLRNTAPSPSSTPSGEIVERVGEMAAELSKANERIDGLGSSITAMDEGRRHLVGKQELFPLLEGLERLVAESDQSERRHLETGSGFEALSRRLDELESLFLNLPQPDADRSKAVVGSDSEPVAPPQVISSVRNVVLERIAFQATQIAAEPIDGPTAILEQNLAAIGLKKSSAQALATEVLAAIGARCIVHFKGAFATLAARACAIALAGNQSFRVAVPVGVINAYELSRAIAAVIPPMRDRATAIVLEGLNNVPVETVVDMLFDLGTGSSGTEMLLFASLGDGPSALPLCTHLLDLGPVYDLDVLEWRLTPPVAAPMISCQVPREALRPIVDASSDMEDFLDLLRKHGRRNPRRERLAASHYRHLGGSSSEDSSALKSAAYGWLLPLWGIIGIPVDEMDHALNGAKCDTSTPDDRLLRILDGFKMERTGGLR